MAPDTYDEILARNIRAARSRVDIGQESLARRMQNLGYTAWIRQTVGATERGRRRPTAAEVAGLSYALETTITRLMSPLDEDREVELQAGGPAVEVTTLRLLAQGKFPVGVIEWDDDDRPVARVTPEPLRSAMRDSFRRMAEEGTEESHADHGTGPDHPGAAS